MVSHGDMLLMRIDFDSCIKCPVHCNPLPFLSIFFLQKLLLDMKLILKKQVRLMTET